MEFAQLLDVICDNFSIQPNKYQNNVKDVLLTFGLD